MKRRILLAFCALGLAASATAIAITAHPARAAYQVTSTDPVVTFDTFAFERAVATFCKANGITTNAQYQSGVAGITAGSALELAAVKAMLGSVTLVP